ncbi:MAG: sigma-70 family RNA polymerase sigma factor [Deltaproteobacteria bacterium]|nr:sigma-70 family RNA polymerase sigma factor [Deltaproteobacteria bacterium]
MDTIFREHARFVTRCIERLVGTGSHVDDILQETFIAAFRNKERFDPERASITTWLYGIAANLCRRHRRGAFRFGRLQNKVASEAPFATLPMPDENIERQQSISLVYDCLQKLPFKQREIFALYELEGLDGGSIADMVGVPVGTVWTRLHHARQAFVKQVRHRTSTEGL